MMVVADTYRAADLLRYCLDLAALNLPAVLENRYLDGVPASLLNALESHYKSTYIPISVFLGTTLDDRARAGDGRP